MNKDKQRAIWELGLVILTGVLHVSIELAFGSDDLGGLQHVFNITAVVAWGAYFGWRVFSRTFPGRALGLGGEHFRQAWRMSLMLAAPAVLLLCVFGLVMDRFPVPNTFWMLIALYPAWGIAQQFGLQVLLTANLRKLLSSMMMRVVIAGGLFSLAHYPNMELMLLTFPAGVAFTWIYERHPNIWAIGIVHGLLGPLAYYMVLGKDLGSEVLQYLMPLLSAS